MQRVGSLLALVSAGSPGPLLTVRPRICFVYRLVASVCECCEAQEGAEVRCLCLDSGLYLLSLEGSEIQWIFYPFVFTCPDSGHSQLATDEVLLEGMM